MMAMLLTFACFLSALSSEPHFGSKEAIHDETHIKQHLEHKVDVNNMTEEQQAFYYFTMYDLNKDHRLDGIDILKAVTHDHSSGEQHCLQNIGCQSLYRRQLAFIHPDRIRIVAQFQATCGKCTCGSKNFTTLNSMHCPLKVNVGDPSPNGPNQSFSQGSGTPVTDEDHYASMIDSALKEMDFNGDGYIDFAEYMKGVNTSK